MKLGVAKPIRAFTFIEVILAIGIALGLLLVALFFYYQCSNLRTQLMAESDKISTVRLVLQKLSSDLRCAQANDQYGFTGTSNTIQFVRSDIVPESAWLQGTNQTTATRLPTGLLQVGYGFLTQTQATNVVSLGIFRTEEILDLSRGFGTSFDLANATNINSTFAQETNALGATNALSAPLTALIKVMQFRYWNGSSWTNAWDGTAPPRGVEVVLSTEPEDTTGTNTLTELYRRIVFIPAGGNASANLGLVDFL